MNELRALSGDYPREPSELIRGTTRTYGLLMGALNVAIPAGLQAEYHPAADLALVSAAQFPFSPVYFKGLMNLRGNLIPLYDLQEWFLTVLAPSSRQDLLAESQSIVDPQPVTAGVIVLGQGERSIGFWCSKPPQKMDMKPMPSSAVPQALQCLKSYSSHLYEAVGQLWIELNMGRLGMELSQGKMSFEGR